MNKRSKIYITILAVFIILLILILLKYCSGSGDINALNNNISKLQRENTRLNNEYLTAYKKAKALEEKIVEREREVERLTRINNTLRRRLLRPNAVRGLGIRYQRIIDRLRLENKRLLERNRITINRNKNLERENNKLRQEIVKLNNTVKKLERDNVALKNENNTLKKEIALLKKQKPDNRAAAQNVLLIKEIEKLRKENADLRRTSDNNNINRLREENTRLTAENKKLKEARGEPSNQIVQLNKRNALLVKEIERLKIENKRLKEQTSGTQGDGSTAEIKRLKELNTKYIKEIRVLKAENSRLRSGQRPITRGSATTREANDNTRLNNIIKDLRTQNAQAANTNQTLKQENARLVKEIERIKSANQSSTNTVNNQQVVTLTNEVERLKKENASLKASGGSNTRQRELEREIERLKKEIERLKNTGNTPDAALITELKRLREENARLKTATPASADNSRELNLKLSNAENQIVNLRNQLNVLKNQRERVVRDAAAASRPADTSALDNRIRLLEKQINQKEVLIKQYKSEIVRLKKELDKQKAAYVKIIEGLRKDIRTGNVRTRMEGSSIRMIFMNEILFASGSTRISAKGARILRVVGNQLKKLKNRSIYVEGHTDSNPVVDWRIRRYYPTNWEFSVVRATRVSRFLIREIKLDPKVITAAGRGEYMPRRSNATPRGRAVNRRIEILVSPKSVVLENRNRQIEPGLERQPRQQ